MPKVPSFAKAFAGRWRIVEMDTWDNAFLDLVEEAHITFTGASELSALATLLSVFSTCRAGRRPRGSACISAGKGRCE